jgi:hypothetical protein
MPDTIPIDQIDIPMGNAHVIQTGTSLGNSFSLQAYDVNNTTYRDFITLSANNTPSCAIGAPSGGTLAIDGATLGGNQQINIANASSITTNVLTVVDEAIIDGDMEVSGGITVLAGIIGFRPIVTVSGTTKTLALSDANTFQNCSNGSAQTITFPADATANFSIGDEVDFFQAGAGQLIFAAAGGVTLLTLSGNLKSAGQYSGFSAKKLASNTFCIVGNLTS